MNHELDAEEREFKKALEGRDEVKESPFRRRNKGYDRIIEENIEAAHAVDDDDLDADFSDAQTAQLEMIEKYRSSLLKEDDDNDEDTKSPDLDGDLV